MITLKLHMLHSQSHCSCEWSYLQRVIPNCEKLFTRLQDAINQTFWPTLFKASVSEPETKLFSLPARLGGTGV